MLAGMFVCWFLIEDAVYILERRLVKKENNIYYIITVLFMAFASFNVCFMTPFAATSTDLKNCFLKNVSLGMFQTSQ